MTGGLVPAPANLSFAEAAAIPYGGLMALHFLLLGDIRKGQRVLIYGASSSVGTMAVQLAGHSGAEVTGACSTANLELVRSGRRKTSRLKLACQGARTPGGKYLSVDRGAPRMTAGRLLLLTGHVEAGRLKPVIDRQYRLEQIAEAHRYVEQGHKRGNVVITVTAA